MLYFLAEYFTKLEFLKSIYLRAFLAFVISFFIVLFVGKPFIKYLKVKKFGEEIRDDGPSSLSAWRWKAMWQMVRSCSGQVRDV